MEIRILYQPTSKVYYKDKWNHMYTAKCKTCNSVKEQECVCVTVAVAVIKVVTRNSVEQFHIQMKEKFEPWNWYIGQILQQQQTPEKWKSP